MRESQKSEHLFRPGKVLAFGRQYLRQARNGLCQVGFELALRGGQQVFDRSEALAAFRELECSHQAEMGDRMGRLAENGHALEDDRALVCGLKAADDVEQR